MRKLQSIAYGGALFFVVLLDIRFIKWDIIACGRDLIRHG